MWIFDYNYQLHKIRYLSGSVKHDKYEKWWNREVVSLHRMLQYSWGQLFSPSYQHSRTCIHHSRMKQILKVEYAWPKLASHSINPHRHQFLSHSLRPVQIHTPLVNLWEIPLIVLQYNDIYAGNGRRTEITLWKKKTERLKGNYVQRGSLQAEGKKCLQWLNFNTTANCSDL